ncbi:hypothetical protein LCGC14_0857710 [marine sediment metagenome]|uniref:SAM-dependent methyltransferase TRM5/TYW2-type domain-containing protein n=1 Tax=marine sediment metagenome TaxID=412755 RepID=A0A0F9SFD9_9ZZZZ
MGFKDKLKQELKGKLTEEELSLLPRGFQTLGNVIILKLKPKLINMKKIISEVCLTMFPKINSVFINLGKIAGTFREPEKIEFVTGENIPIVKHKEHGITYKFDITKIMFSKGNLKERKFITTLVKREETIVDMFAGIGYFSLPIGKHSQPEKIYSIEFNAVSYKYLVENIKINHLEQKIIPIKGDCKEEVLKLSKFGIRADRVIMGVFPAPKNFIKEALSLTKDVGTFFHYEGIAEKEKYISLFKDFAEIAEKNKYKCELESYRFVKSYGPNLYHIVLDILVKKM